MAKQEFMLMRKIGGRTVDAFYTDQVKAAYQRIPKGESVEVVFVRAESRPQALEQAPEARGWKVVTRRSDGTVMFARTNPMSKRLPGFTWSEWTSLLELVESIEAMPDTPRRRKRVIETLSMVNDDLNGAGVDFIQVPGRPPDLVYVDINSADEATLMFMCGEGRFVVGSLREGINKVTE